MIKREPMFKEVAFKKMKGKLAISGETEELMWQALFKNAKPDSS